MAILTGLVSIIVVKMQKNNKKQEIDYLNESEIKKEVRKHATEIVTSANEISVGINKYVYMLDKTIALSGKKEIAFQKKSTAHKTIQKTSTEKIEQINKNIIKIVEHLTQYELYFADSKFEHKAVKQAQELLALTNEFKTILFKIQGNFDQKNFPEEKKELEKLRLNLNNSIDCFSKETRKALRTFRFSLHGSIRVSDLIELIFRSRKDKATKEEITGKKRNIIFLFIGLSIGLSIGFSGELSGIMKLLMTTIFLSIFKFIFSDFLVFFCVLFFITTIIFIYLWIKERNKKRINNSIEVEESSEN